MEWVDQLRGHVIGLDTAPLIYFIEEHPKYLDLVKPFFESLDRGEFQVVTSPVTRLEVLAQPFRQNNSRLAQHYRDILLHANHITTTWLTPDIAERRRNCERNTRLPHPMRFKLQPHCILAQPIFYK